MVRQTKRVVKTFAKRPAAAKAVTKSAKPAKKAAAKKPAAKKPAKKK